MEGDAQESDRSGLQRIPFRSGSKARFIWESLLHKKSTKAFQRDSLGEKR